MRARALAPRTPAVPPSAGVRFALAVGSLGLAIHLLYRLGDRLWAALAPLDAATAWAAAALIRGGGLAVERSGAVLASPEGFAYGIHYRCTGLVPVLFLLVGLAALPGGGWAKVRAGAAGAAVLVGLNQLRLAGLFWVGVRHPRAFAVAHQVVGEVGMILAIVILWLAWLRRAAGTEAGGTERP